VKTETVAAIYDRRRRSQTAATERAVELLRKGEVVALPTETVYGLAADALDPIAVAKIFEAKSRPNFDPLIIHLPDAGWLKKVADVPTGDRESVVKVAEKFWPGPLTIVLPKRDIVPGIVTAGLNTVAVRISAHPVFAEIIREFGRPLAAPSANRFGRISPTTAQHVSDELNGRIPLVIDAGPTTHGIESTIITIRSGKIEILRRGPITSEQLAPFATKVDFITDNKSVSAPGQLPSHYAPKTLLQLIDDAKEFAPAADHQVGLLAWNPSNSEKRFAAVRHLSESHDFREAAANLFRYLRELDALELDLIVAERVPLQGLGAAIMDRLTRAARGSIDT
jgi:L-threonylcarbamoyladenylate synthase